MTSVDVAKVKIRQVKAFLPKMNRMKLGRNLVAGVVLALLAVPPRLSARPDTPAMTPHPDDFSFISLERDSELTSVNPAPTNPPEALPEVYVEKSGAIPAKEGTRLRVNAEPGNVHIYTDGSSQISYRVRVEADAREPGAQDIVRQFAVTMRETPNGVILDGNLPWREFRGPFSVSYEIHVPRRLTIKVRTLGGNIDVQDIEGRVDLFTEGGNITLGRVDAGNMLVPAAKLTTMGGHISTGDVTGTLRASSSGGHITTGNIGGDAILHTGGGQIRTGRISGAATLDTEGGNITASLVDQGTSGTQKDAKTVHSPRPNSQFVSTEGDVIVYLPRDMAASIDAVIEQGGGHRIYADPSLPQKISCDDGIANSGTIRCAGDLNGGGEILHLRAESGNIVLKVGDPRMESNATHSSNWMENAIRPPAIGRSDSPLKSASTASAGSQSASSGTEDYNDAAGFFAEVRRKILESWWGGVPVDADEMQKHLEHSVPPVYPDVARKAGVEGDVILRIYVSSDGRVTGLKVLDGPPILVRAAVEAVQQWKYHALKMNGEPIAAVTTMIVSFRLQ